MFLFSLQQLSLRLRLSQEKYGDHLESCVVDRIHIRVIQKADEVMDLFGRFMGGVMDRKALMC